jgi:hypothetical protein
LIRTEMVVKGMGIIDRTGIPSRGHTRGVRSFFSSGLPYRRPGSALAHGNSRQAPDARAYFKQRITDLGLDSTLAKGMRVVAPGEFGCSVLR